MNVYRAELWVNYFLRSFFLEGTYYEPAYRSKPEMEAVSDLWIST